LFKQDPPASGGQVLDLKCATGGGEGKKSRPHWGIRVTLNEEAACVTKWLLDNNKHRRPYAFSYLLQGLS
jgi:hypothetical protein